MVDSNLNQHLEQREKLLYSEKAWAYRMKLEALDHQGVKSDVPGQLSVDILSQQTGESKSQIFRIVRLTELIIALLDKVDSKQLAFNPAVELSCLSQIEQTAVATAMVKYAVKPSLSQAVRLRELKKAGELTTDQIDGILSEIKKPPKSEANDFSRFRKYFPPEYSQKQMEADIVGLLKAREAEQKRIRKEGAAA
jgi:ParB family chromosome partitioning protein